MQEEGKNLNEPVSCKTVEDLRSFMKKELTEANTRLFEVTKTQMDHLEEIKTSTEEIKKTSISLQSKTKKVLETIKKEGEETFEKKELARRAVVGYLQAWKKENKTEKFEELNEIFEFENNCTHEAENFLEEEKRFKEEMERLDARARFLERITGLKKFKGNYVVFDKNDNLKVFGKGKENRSNYWKEV